LSSSGGDEKAAVPPSDIGQTRICGTNQTRTHTYTERETHQIDEMKVPSASAGFHVSCSCSGDAEI